MTNALHLLRRRRQPGQVERHAADQLATVGLGRGRKASLFQPGQNEVIHRLPWPSDILHIRRDVRSRCPKRPEFPRLRPIDSLSGRGRRRVRPAGDRQRQQGDHEDGDPSVQSACIFRPRPRIMRHQHIQSAPVRVDSIPPRLPNRKRSLMRRALATVLVPVLLATALAAAPLGSGIDRANFDTSVKPRRRLLRIRQRHLDQEQSDPAGIQPVGGVPQARDDNLLRLEADRRRPRRQAPTLDPDRRKIRDFYATAMDEAKLEQQGPQPLEDGAGAIEKIESAAKTLAKLIGRFAGHAASRAVLLRHRPGRKAERPIRRPPAAGRARVAGEGLLRRQHRGLQAHPRPISRARAEDAGAAGRFARRGVGRGRHGPEDRDASWPRRRARPCSSATARPTTTRRRVGELAGSTPNFDWDTVPRSRSSARQVHDVIVGQPEFFQRGQRAGRRRCRSADWRTYLRWHLIHSTAPYLSTPFEDENFRFYSEVLRGVKEMQPRWKRGDRHDRRHDGRGARASCTSRSTSRPPPSSGWTSW